MWPVAPAGAIGQVNIGLSLLGSALLNGTRYPLLISLWGHHDTIRAICLEELVATTPKVSCMEDIVGVSVRSGSQSKVSTELAANRIVRTYTIC